jgi:hypothetical protein
MDQLHMFKYSQNFDYIKSSKVSNEITLVEYFAIKDHI